MSVDFDREDAYLEPKPFPVWKRLLVRYLCVMQVVMPTAALMGMTKDAVAQLGALGISAATEGQADGLSAIQGMVASPPAMVDGESPLGGGGTSVFSNEIIPGSSGLSGSDVMVWGSMFFGNAGSMGSNARTDYFNLNEIGCANTTAKPVAGQQGRTILTVTPYLRDAAGNDTPTYLNYQMPLGIFGSLGEMRGSVELGVPSVFVPPAGMKYVLKVQKNPFTAPSDGSFFTNNHLTTNGGTIVNYGNLANRFATQGTLLIGSGNSILADLWKVERSYTPVPNTGGCPQDPPNCSSWSGLNICSGSPAWGVTQGTPNIFTRRVTNRAGAAALVRQSQYGNNMAVEESDAVALLSKPESARAMDGTSSVFSEIFTGCSTTTANTTGTSSTIHTPDLHSCLRYPTNLTNNGCTSNRSLNIAPLQSATPFLQITFYKELLDANGVVTGYDPTYRFSGTIPFSHPVASAGNTWRVAVGGEPNAYMQYSLYATNISGILPYNPRVGSNDAASASLTVNSVGRPSDWMIDAVANINSATSVTFVVDLHQIIMNEFDANCKSNFAALSDGFCRVNFYCSDDRSAGTTVGPLPFAMSGPYTGYLDMLADMTSGAAKADSPKLCWQWKADPSTCDLSCSYDASGNPINCLPNTCNTFGDPAWKDDCCTRPLIENVNGSPVNGTPLAQNPKCKHVGTQCAGTDMLGSVSGTCYSFNEIYDCGESSTVTTPGNTVVTSQTCGATPIACLGSECHNVKEEVSNEFTKVAASVSMINSLQSEMRCKDDVQPTSIFDSCPIEVFKGEVSRCRIPAQLIEEFGAEDCCSTAYAAAMSMSQQEVFNYVKLSYYSYKLATYSEGAKALAQVPGLGSVAEAWGSAANGINGAIGSVSENVSSLVSSTTSTMTNAAASVAKQFSVDITNNTAVTAAKEWVGGISNSAGAAVSSMQQYLYQGIQNIATDAFGKEFASQIIAEGVGPEAGQLVLGPMLGAIMGFINIVMLVYAILKIIVALWWGGCTEDEMKLGNQRRLGNCFLVPSTYCTGWLKFFGQKMGCNTYTNTYCCYKSMLGRIIMEQARSPSQLNNLGTAENPNCSGLSVEEMDKVDWDRIDLTEWVNTLLATGILPQSDVQADQMYAPDNAANLITGKANVTGTDPADILEAQIGQKTEMISQTAQAVGNTSAVCYDANNPEAMAWYQSTTQPTQVAVESILFDTGGGGGSIEPCDPNNPANGCAIIKIGRDDDDYLLGTGNPQKSSYACGSHQECHSCGFLGLSRCCDTVTDYCDAYTGTCTLFDQRYAIRIRRPEAIQSAILEYVRFDDRAELVMNSVNVWSSHGIMPTANAANPQCEVGSQTAAPNIDLTSNFRAGNAGSFIMRSQVGIKGEGHARIRVLYNGAAGSNSAPECFGPSSSNPPTVQP